MTVDPAQRDPVANAAQVSANETDPNEANNTSPSVQTTVVAQVALQVSKTVDNATPDEGSIITFTIVVTNAGPSTATGVTVSDTLPSGVSQVGSVTLDPTSIGEPGAPPTLASGLTVGVGEPVTLTLTVKVLDGPATITNRVEVTSTEEATAATDSASISVRNVAPTADANGPYEVPEGKSVILLGIGTDPGGSYDTLTYEWDLDDDGNFGETGAAATRGDETGATPTFHAPLVGATEDVFVTLRVSDEDGDSTDSSEARVTILAIELALLKQDIPDPVRAGSRLTYRITITNTSDAPADNVVLTDTLPSEYITLVSFTPPKGGKCVGTSTVVCELPAVAVGATVVFTAVLDVHRDTPANEILLNQAEVSSSASYTAVTERTVVYRTRATEPGDCNGDLAVDAADITAIVLWIFDGAFQEMTGCDANRDTRVDAGDIACAVLMIFQGPDACSIDDLNTGEDQPGASDPGAPSNGPALAMPVEVPAEIGGRVTVPVNFRANGHEISSLVFSVDYDESWLSFDATDHEGDGLPDTVAFNLPGGVSASVMFDESDSDGELDIFIADIFPPLTALSDGELLSITLNVDNPGGAAWRAVRFSQHPRASFGNTEGQSMPGTTTLTGEYHIYLPNILFDNTVGGSAPGSTEDGSMLITVATPTITPTPMAVPTATNTSTSTSRPTPTPTLTPTTIRVPAPAPIPTTTPTRTPQ